MTTIALHQPPAPRAVFAQQLRCARGAMRNTARGLLAVGLALILGTALFAWGNPAKGPDAAFWLAPQFTSPIWLVALLAAATLWQRDEPSRRGYHLAMPVATTHHTAQRVAAAWLLLMGWVAAYLLLLLTLAVVNVSIMGGHLYSLMGWWGWVLPFFAATMSYLLFNIAFVACERPLVWLLGVPGVLGALIALPYVYKWQALSHQLDRLMTGPFRLSAPFFPLFQVRDDFRQPLTTDWPTTITAILFWTTVGLVGVWLAARHRPRGAQ